MLRFTKRADYGLMAMHYIAAHGDEGAVSGSPSTGLSRAITAPRVVTC
jgi:DNA-binding IscR family transcriptional regulator